MRTPPTVSYQGELGSNSATVCADMFPGSTHLPCATFQDALEALSGGGADLAIIPLENSTAGRVADVHHLLPGSGLFIVNEHFLPIHFQLAGVPGATLSTIRSVRSHVHALGQCRNLIRGHGWAPVVSEDTAGAAREVAEMADVSIAALSPEAAVEMYGLCLLASHVEDEQNNTTRFIVLSPEPAECPPGGAPAITSMIFRVKNLAGSLHRALGSFADAEVNVTKLESYQLEGSFQATQFFADIEGHPLEAGTRRALGDLRSHVEDVRILGTYPADPYRRRPAGPLPG